MRKCYFLIFIFALSSLISSAQPCTTTNAAGCQCKDGATNCDLLPDITIGQQTLSVGGNNGVIEYSQTSGSNPGQLRISVETPNIGHGPLHTLTTTTFVCPDSIYQGVAPASCNDGSAPKTIVNQNIYHKNGSTMSSWQHPAGSMTYHPTHGHMHYDDWGIYTLRLQILGVTNPLLWPIVGNGAKLGFCLLDYGDCDTYGDCRNGNGPILHNADFANFGLGGGSYSCTPNNQGISVGWADVYYQYLDGMYITIPPGTCNGQYYIVVQVDPYDYFLEEDETNNVLAMPWTLSQQDLPGNPICTISQNVNSGSNTYCFGDTIILTANQAAFSYAWSNGQTTRSISVTQTGNYSCTINNYCGIATSNAIAINFSIPSIPAITNSSICGAGSATLTATANGNISWFNFLSGGSEIAAGNNLVLNNVPNTATYYAQNTISIPGLSNFNQPYSNTIGTNANHTDSTRYQLFTVVSPCILKSVKVYATGAGNRTIVLRNQNGAYLQSSTINLAAGENTVLLNFNLTPGNYRLGYGNGIPNLSRNSSGIIYPYTIPGVLSITGSSAGAGFYYFYYNWEVQTLPTMCTSNRIGATVTVNTIPVPLISGLATICNTTPANLNAGSGFSSYLWSNGSTSQSISASTPGNYSVTVIDNNNCSGSSSFVNVVNDVFPTATITASGATTVCKGTALTLTANSGSGFTYSWKRNGVLISSATNINYNPTISGGYRVLVTNASGCSKLSANTTVIINALPTALITPQGSTNICTSGSVVLTANYSNGYLYQWRKNGLNISGATNQSYQASLVGNYRVLVTNSNGCQKLSGNIPITGCRIELEENIEFADILSVRPNPNSGKFFVDFENINWSENPVAIEIFNNLGQLIFKDNYEIAYGKNSFQIELNEKLSNGVYLIKLSSENEIMSRNFIINY